MAMQTFLLFSSPRGATAPRSEPQFSRFRMTVGLPTKHSHQSRECSENIRKLLISPQEPRPQPTYTMPPEKREIFDSLENWAEENLLTRLKPVEESWQPQDFLPDPYTEVFFDEVREIRARAKEIPDDYYVCLVGDMITEEALPTYQSLLNISDGIRDETGSSPSSWATWNRLWTAEENRHGDLLNKYLYLSGRVDMKQIEKSIHYLIGSGMDAGLENNPYLVFVYTSFQERATAISHGNTARLAKKYGDMNLAKICGIIAADEKRHEAAYSKIVEKLFEVDPNTAMLAFAKMMRKGITMPARLVYDGKDQNLFQSYSAVAQRIGVYTSRDYLEIFEFLMRRWNVDKVSSLSSDGVEAQDYLCGLGQRMRRLIERSEKMAKETCAMSFTWIFNKQV